MPGLIFNNKKIDAKDLARFHEPAWNNPVIRFFDSEWKEIVPRKDSLWSTGDVALRLVEVLRAAKQEVPGALELVALENSKGSEWATFAMHCYWEGEVQFGQLAGVKSTRSAWYEGKEVVHVEFDPARTEYRTLVEHALKVRCASTVYARSKSQKEVASALASDRVQRIGEKEFGRDAKNSDQKYYLSSSPMRLVPMTSIQQMKVNSSLGRRQSGKSFLIAIQNRMADWIKKNYENKELIKELDEAQHQKTFQEYFEFVRQRMK